MIEILEELLTFTRIFNNNGFEFKNYVIDKDAVENPVADDEYFGINDVNAGAIGNVLEYERRLARFLIDMLFLHSSKGEYLDIIGGDWMNNERPDGYDDEKYLAYLNTKILGGKETPNYIITTLQPFSSQPVLIFESGSWKNGMFFNTSYLGYYEQGKRDSSNKAITPALMGGSNVEGTGDFFFRIKLQPNDEISEKIILILLFFSHVSGVAYEIEYYSVPPWH